MLSFVTSSEMLVITYIKALKITDLIRGNTSQLSHYHSQLVQHLLTTITGFINTVRCEAATPATNLLQGLSQLHMKFKWTPLLYQHNWRDLQNFRQLAPTAVLFLLQHLHKKNEVRNTICSGFHTLLSVLWTKIWCTMGTLLQASHIFDRINILFIIIHLAFWQPENVSRLLDTSLGIIKC